MMNLDRLCIYIWMLGLVWAPVWFGFGSNLTVRCRIRTFRQYLKRTFDEQHNEGPNIDRLVRPWPVVRVDDLELLDMLQSDRPNYPFWKILNMRSLKRFEGHLVVLIILSNVIRLPIPPVIYAPLGPRCGDINIFLNYIHNQIIKLWHGNIHNILEDIGNVRKSGLLIGEKHRYATITGLLNSASNCLLLILD